MTTLAGIDISDYQTTTPPLTGLAFCIAKASEGMSAAKTYGMHVANTRKAGIVTGAYHFARNDSTGTPAQQAAFFLQTAGDVDLYAVDVEGFHAFSLAQSQSFIAVMHAAGKRIGMYGSVSGFQRAGQDWDWVAFYNPTPPTIPYDIWQYGPRRIGAVDVDGDTFAGDAVALAKLIGGSQGGPNQPGDEMAFASDPNPKLIDVPAGQPQFELDGKTVFSQTTAHTGAYSPYGLGTVLRAFLISYSAGQYKLVLAVPAKIYPLPTAPVPVALGPGLYKVG